MKRIFTLFLVLTLLLPTLACQPTPDADIIGNKGDGTMNNAIRTEINPIQQIEVPETYTFTDSYYDNQVDLNINASIEFPQSKALPVWSAEIIAWNQQQIEQILYALFGDGAAFTDGGGYIRTKSEIAEYELKPTQQLLQDLRDGKDVGGDDAGPYTEESLLASLAYIQQSYASAPEIRMGLPVDAASYVNTVGEWRAVSTLPSGAEAEVLVFRYPDSLDISLHLRSMDGSYISLDLPIEQLSLQTTPAQARAIAEDLVRKMGAEGFDVASISAAQRQSGGEGTNDPSKAAYCVLFTPTINGMRTGYDNNGKNSEFYYSFSSPSISVIVNDEGVCGLYWDSPTVITGLRTENVQLVEFSEVMRRAREYLPYMMDGYWTAPDMYNNQNIHETTNINRVVLSYYRILEKGGDKTFLWIPVWEFYGDRFIQKTEEIIKLYGEQPPQIYDITPILIINAIDGTIIDLQTGY